MRDTTKERIAQVRRGEVPEGYQRSHLYTVPEGWKVKRLGEITQRTSRKNRNDRSYPACSINNQIGFILQSEQFEQGSYDFLDKTSYKIVEKDEFAYNPARINVGSIGRLKNMDKAIVSSLYVCFKLSDKNDATYFENWFNGYDFHKEIIRNLEGSVREYLFYENFSRIRMPVPPIAEQQKIAEILVQCDKVITLKQELLGEKRKQKKWMMQRLLTGKTRLNGYSEKWKSANMRELFLFGGALAASREQLGDEGFCYLHYGDIHANDTFEIDLKREYAKIPKLQCDKVQDRYLLKDGDVVFVDASEDYLGASKYVVIKNLDNIPFISGLHTMPIREKGDELLTAYKRYCFQSETFVRQIAFYVSGMKILGVNKDNLGKIVLKYPSKDEQAAIASILSTADKEINLLEQELAAWKQKKKGLAQLLLTGLVRV